LRLVVNQNTFLVLFLVIPKNSNEYKLKNTNTGKSLLKIQTLFTKKKGVEI